MATSFRRTFALLIAAGTGIVPGLAATAAKTAAFDVTTYTIPEGFEILAGGASHANFRRIDSGNWILFGVYGSKASSGDLVAEFAADWKDISGAPTVAAPAPKSRKVGTGVAAVEGGADCPGIGYVDLVDIDAGGKVVSIIIESGNADGFSKTYRQTIEAFLSSVVVKAAAKSAPVADLTPSANAPKGKTERVPEASFKKGGMPQGMFVGTSLLSGKAICLLFLSEGRVTRAIPSGGLDAFDWAEHQSKNGGNCGTWSMAGETLTITWGMGGGVNTGVLNETAEGVEFYGKRYSRPAKTDASKLAGSWESGRTVGAMTITSTLDIGADGSYHWVTESGGVIGGRAVANNSRDERGTMSLSGRTATFRAAEGTVKTYTLNVIAGNPLTAFSIENDMFTKR